MKNKPGIDPSINTHNNQETTISQPNDSSIPSELRIGPPVTSEEVGIKPLGDQIPNELILKPKISSEKIDEIALQTIKSNNSNILNNEHNTDDDNEDISDNNNDNSNNNGNNNQGLFELFKIIIFV